MLPQRLDGLTKRDGEIEALLARHLDGDRSTIAQTLARQVGEQSPLFKLLSPTEAGGLVAVLSRGLEQALLAQRKDLLKRLQPVLDGTRAASRRRTVTAPSRLRGRPTCSRRPGHGRRRVSS